MSAAGWEAAARAEGLAPDDAPAPARPWPVVVLTALGAWLAVPPFLLLFFMLFGDAWQHGVLAYVEGIGLTAVAVVLLRSRGIALFLEQVAVPLLLTGLASLAYALARDLPALGAELVGLAVAVALIVLLSASWLRVLLGLSAALLSAMVFSDLLMSDLGSFWSRAHGPSWAVAVLLLATGVAMLAAQRRLGAEGRTAGAAAALEPMLTGWWIAVLGLLVILAGRSSLALGAVPSLDHGGRAGGPPLATWLPLTSAMAVSAALALFAGGGLMACWAWARSWRLAPPLALLTVLAGMMPSLGGCLAVLALMLVTKRPRIAVLAAAAALWVLGSFYYQLDWRLADKALVLVGAGALLAAWAWWVAVPPSARGAESPASRSFAGRGAAERQPVLVLIAAGVVALALVNGFIWQKERLIAEGRRVFVPLAPVDPRSLVQGDYMRLSYDLPGVDWRRRSDAEGQSLLWGARPRVAAVLDARGVVTSSRMLGPDEPLPPGAQLIELTPKSGGWTFVADAWFFREGEMTRWQIAKYGEFRVTPDGRALLVRVVGDDLTPL